MPIVWTKMNSRAAANEGWGLHPIGDRHVIQRALYITPTFKCDDDAIAFVRAGARAGNVLHMLALALCGETITEHVPVRVWDQPPMRINTLAPSNSIETSPQQGE